MAQEHRSNPFGWIVLGFVAAMIPLFVLEPALTLWSAMLGGTGLFLLPQLSPAVRNQDEAATCREITFETTLTGKRDVRSVAIQNFLYFK